jgi:hypothetical protein
MARSQIWLRRMNVMMVNSKKGVNKYVWVKVTSGSGLGITVGKELLTYINKSDSSQLDLLDVMSR